MTGRQMDILNYLREQKDFVTVSEISRVIQMSVTTIRNELNMIQEAVEQASLGKICKKPNKGIKLDLAEEAWDHLLSLSEESQLNSDIPVAKYQIIYYLLTNCNLSLSYIQKKFYISRSYMEKLLPDIKSWLQLYEITFEKEGGKGFHIKYKEFQWRLAMWNLFLKVKQEKDKDSLPGKQMEYQAFDYSFMEGFLKGFDSSGINRTIYQLEQAYGFSYGYEAHIQMQFLLSLCIIRTRQKYMIQLPQAPLVRVSGGFTGIIKKELVKRLEAYYQIKLGPEEQDYIGLVVEISDIQKFYSIDEMSVCQSENLELCYFTIRMVSLMSDIVNVNLRSDTFFLESLFLQLHSMIPRLRYHIKTEHPLLKQVKQRYPNIFTAISAVSVYFQKELGLDINEHEMCTLALLLGGAIERSLSTVAACVVCDYGLGISQLLKEQLERTISDIKIVEVLSVRDLKKIIHIPCDLVITTIQLKNICYGKPVVTVEHLLTANDIKTIEDAMKQVRRRNIKNRQHCSKLSICKNLFYEEFMFLHMDALDKQSLMSLLCKKLTEAGYVTDQFLPSVMEHEVTAPTALGKGIALPHGFTKYVMRPTVAIATLASPITWQGKEKVDVIFLLAFNLDEAVGMKEETIKFYSVFLDLLDETEKIDEIRQARDPEALAGLMNQKIMNAVVLEE